MSCFPKINRETQKLIVIVLSPHSGWKLENPLIKKRSSLALYCVYSTGHWYHQIWCSNSSLMKVERNERMNEWSKTNQISLLQLKKSTELPKRKKKCCQIYLKQCCFFIIHCFLPSASPLPSPPFRFACKWHTFYFFKVHQPLVAYTALKLCSFTSGCCKKNYVVIDRGLELF